MKTLITEKSNGIYISFLRHGSCENTDSGWWFKWDGGGIHFHVNKNVLADHKLRALRCDCLQERHNDQPNNSRLRNPS